MDLRKVKKLIELVRESGIAELEVRGGDEAVRVVNVPAGLPASVAATPAATPAAPPPAPAKTAGGHEVTAPVSGTFYRSPAPGEPPFVEVGQVVQAGDVLCIIESMKMMNRVEADSAGKVAEVLLDNGLAIEAGTPLFRIV